MSEADLQVAIHADLRNMGIKFDHIEKGRGGSRQKYQHSNGRPDLYIFSGNGRVVNVEVKTKTGKAKDTQIEWFNWSKENGYSHYFVHNISEWEMVKKIEGWD